MLNLGQVSCGSDEFAEQFRTLSAPAPGSVAFNPRWGIDQLVRGGWAREHQDRLILTNKVLQDSTWEQDFLESCDK
jgi:hypothetical protein